MLARAFRFFTVSRVVSFIELSSPHSVELWLSTRRVASEEEVRSTVPA